MFRHRGKARTYKHNFRLAVFLSFTAGLVNICGLLALGVLTTNVTGHFAFFSEAIQKHDLVYASVFLFYILSFLLGAFSSSLITEYYIRKESFTAYNTAIFIEIGLLFLIGTLGNNLPAGELNREFLSCVLLFAMGLQNSLVTSISNSTVRTTHLTGLFTDLGIELSQLFYYRAAGQRERLKKNIYLRCGIIAFFFLGCVSGGFLFTVLKFKVLIIGAIILFAALGYDNLRLFYFKKIKRGKSGGL